MVETGNWSISDLIDYLVQVQNTLTPDEFSRLKSFEVFTVEGDMGERPRYRALDLYPPLANFRQLQLPVIDWGGKSRWQNESDHGKQSTSLEWNTVNRIPSSRTAVWPWFTSSPAFGEHYNTL